MGLMVVGVVFFVHSLTVFSRARADERYSKLTRSLEKTSRYQTLQQLHKADLLDGSLVKLLSEHIEESLLRKSGDQLDLWKGLAKHVSVDEQLKVAASHEMASHIFGNKARSNSLLKELTLDCQLKVLKACTKQHFESGEFVYNKDQVADKSTLHSPVYLIQTGRVSCRLTRNACFKQYVEGSFFGDIECLAGLTRLCSVKAESALSLAAIDKKSFSEILAHDFESRLKVERLVLRRYLTLKHSMRKASAFSLLHQENEFWQEADQTPAPLNSKVDALISLIDRDRRSMNSNSVK